MKISTECSCGAKLEIATSEGAIYSTRNAEAAEGQRLVEQFRRDHKPCREKTKAG